MKESSSVIKHVIGTRLNYKDENRLKERLQLMKLTLLPCLEAQTNKNFTWIVISENNKDLLKKEISYPFVQVRNVYRSREWVDYVKKNSINIQTRLDSDDKVSANYVETIQNEYKKQVQINDEFIIDFQPIVQDFDTKLKYQCKARYHDKCVSMFASYCSTQAKKTIWDQEHPHLHRLTKNIIQLGEGFVEMVIHENNLLNGLHLADKLMQEDNERQK